MATPKSPHGMNAPETAIPGLTTPLTISIGVTGHRNFLSNSRLTGPKREQYREFLENRLRSRTRMILGTLDLLLLHTSHIYTVVSPLAEGADQVIADEILKWSNPYDPGQGSAQLEFILPMPESEYTAHFSSPKSRVTFDTLRGKVNQVIGPLLPSGASREIRHQAYAAAGRLVAERCDILIAAWDGESWAKTAGTAATVEQAQHLGRTVFQCPTPRRHGFFSESLAPLSKFLALIDASRFTFLRRFLPFPQSLQFSGVTILAGELPILASFRFLEAYNKDLQSPRWGSSLSPLMLNDPHQVAAEVIVAYSDLCQTLTDPSARQYFENTYSTDLHRLLLPIQRQTSRLARYYQRLYNRTVGTAVYVLSAAAVATVSSIQAFAAHANFLYWIEVAEIVAILIILAMARVHDYHRKRVDYRVLAERLRAAVYLYLVGLRPRDNTIPAYLRTSHHPDRWIDSIFDALTSHLDLREPWPQGLFVPLRQFILAAWIDRQIDYYTATSHDYSRKHRFLEAASFGVFALTAAVAILHSAGVWHETHTVGPILNLMATSLPAVGAALAGILVHREYHRNLLRYQQVTKALRVLRAEAGSSSDPTALRFVLSEAYHLMLREQQGWTMTVSIQPPSPA
jgi:SMODS and SLOG-associating 2TM effector domain 1